MEVINSNLLFILALGAVVLFNIIPKFGSKPPISSLHTTSMLVAQWKKESYLHAARVIFGAIVPLIFLVPLIASSFNLYDSFSELDMIIDSFYGVENYYEIEAIAEMTLFPILESYFTLIALGGAVAGALDALEPIDLASWANKRGVNCYAAYSNSLSGTADSFSIGAALAVNSDESGKKLCITRAAVAFIGGIASVGALFLYLKEVILIAIYQSFSYNVPDDFIIDILFNEMLFIMLIACIAPAVIGNILKKKILKAADTALVYPAQSEPIYEEAVQETPSSEGRRFTPAEPHYDEDNVNYNDAFGGNKNS